MLSRYRHLKQSPWRHVAAAAVLCILVVVLLGGWHNRSSVARLVPTEDKSKASETGLGVVDHVFNSTLGFEKVLAISLPERTDHRDGLILAAAVSNIDITFVDGVHGESVLDKALPPGKNDQIRNSTIGSWRAHLDAIASVVHNNHGSALIMEDDIDWDIRLKSLLSDFALSSNALVQTDGLINIDFNDHSLFPPPQISPYGDNWDLLWLGHCGMGLPPSGMAIHRNDSTVPEPQYLRSWKEDEPTPLNVYPSHTRVVMRQSTWPVCSLAYAVSQQGARKILFQVGLQKFDAPFDVLLRSWCDGDNGNNPQICPGVVPQLFDHYRDVGPTDHDSDISDHSGEVRDKSETLNIRWSVRMNMAKLLDGDMNYEDQYPDTA